MVSNRTNLSLTQKNDRFPQEKTKQRNSKKLHECVDFAKQSVWVPSSYVVLKALVSARLCSAVWNILHDCDETYNYWEPLHFLLFGSGFQTWEYSPLYALRSYSYILVYALPAYLYSRIFQSNRMLVFFFIRCILAIVSAMCEIYFFRGVCKAFGSNVGRITFGFTVICSGLFISSTAFLPSSFAMYMTFLAYGAWFNRKMELVIFCIALSSLLGWPFAALLGVPFAFELLILRRRFKFFFKWVLISLVTILCPMVVIDSAFFGRLVVAPVNLILYNVFSGSGPNLYGVAPVSYYFINGFLNFNILFPLALLSLPLNMILLKTAHVKEGKNGVPSCLMPFFGFSLWLMVFTWQPHKEERFLFPVYPMIPLLAAVSVDSVQRMIHAALGAPRNTRSDKTNWIAIACIAIASTISLSRIIGQYRGYGAPFETFVELHRVENEGEVAASLREVSVCFGREWHRFPSSFFLPSPRWEVRFIKSEFLGQLPAKYARGSATSVIPPHMNNQNKEEVTRYVNPSSCHYLIDIDRKEQTEREPRYSLKSQWKTIYRTPFLDTQKSPSLLRAFYIPILTERYCSYVDYVILKSSKTK